MKILFITAFPPCQKTTGQDYSRRLMLDLLEKGHEISLGYADYPGHEVKLSQLTFHITTSPLSVCSAALS